MPSLRISRIVKKTKNLQVSNYYCNLESLNSPNLKQKPTALDWVLAFPNVIHTYIHTYTHIYIHTYIYSTNKPDAAIAPRLQILHNICHSWRYGSNSQKLGFKLTEAEHSGRAEIRTNSHCEISDHICSIHIFYCVLFFYSPLSNLHRKFHNRFAHMILPVEHHLSSPLATLLFIFRFIRTLRA